MEKLPGHLVAEYDFFHEIKGLHDVKIHSGQVHRYGKNGMARLLQLMVKPGGGFDDIAVQQMDELHLLQYRDEDAGKYHALLRILPPGQGFQAADLSRKGSGYGLVVHMDMTLFHGIFKIPKHKSRIHHIPAQGFGIHRPAPVAILLDGVRRQFGHIEGIPPVHGLQLLRQYMVLIKEHKARFAANGPVLNEVIDFFDHPVHSHGDMVPG